MPIDPMLIDPMLIDPEMCIAGRDLTEPTLSPDGHLIASVTSEAGVTSIRVMPIDGGPERIVTSVPQPAAGRGLGGGCLAWTDEGHGIVYVGRDGGLWVAPVDGAGSRARAMAPGRGLAAPASNGDGSPVVITCDEAEVWMLWPSGEGPALRLDLGEDDFVCDPQIAIVNEPDGSECLHVVWQAWNVPDMAWDHSILRRVRLRRPTLNDGFSPLWEVHSREMVEGIGAILQPRILRDGRISSVRDDHGWLNLWVDEQVLISEPCEHAGPTWGPGLSSYAWSPDESMVAFTRNELGFARLCVMSLDTAEITEIARGVHGHLHWRGEHLVAVRTGARTPTQVVSYRLGSGVSAQSGVGTTRRVHQVGPVIAWDGIDLPEPELFATPLPVTEAEAVGDQEAKLHARLYRAAGPVRSQAVVVWVHGGPTDQWQVTFMPRVAWLWSRGLDVLVVDPRGTTGHGRAYQQALRGRWGELDASDTAAMIRAYQAESGTQPERTLIAGSSSGGLTVLSVLRHHAELVAAGIAISPVSDLADLAERSHRFEAHYSLSLVGDLSDHDRYRELSPVHHADQIAGPLMMIHGEEDPVVPADHSRTLAAEIAQSGGRVDLHLFAGEGHGLRQIPHRLEEYRLIAEFIEQILRGG